MKAKLLFAGLFLVTVSAHAEPRAASPEECYAYADLALVAATLAKHGVARDKTEMMLPDMYEVHSEDGQEMARRIVEAAYRELGQQPKNFAAKVANVCLLNGGSIEPALGVKL